ncbi:MAG: glycosyltransferase family 2 protein [Candidatus Omnitrophica bacterium]|nr:glycosyltransferase family 2 protein [Candidatus Omnitrophota bacterium]
MKISIIIPAHNEEEIIADTIEQIENGLDMEHKIIVINDHSSDSTREKVIDLMKKYPNINLIDNDVGRGFADALRKGFLTCDTEYVIPVMADLCDDVATIKKMYEKMLEGYDLVCGSRYSPGGRRQGGPRLKGLLSCMAGRSLSWLIKIPTNDLPNAFKMYKKKVIDSLEITSKSFEISMEIALKAYFAGFKISEVPTVWKSRTKGTSDFKVLKLLPFYLRLYKLALAKIIKGNNG